MSLAKAAEGRCAGHVYSRNRFQEYPRLCLYCGEPEPFTPPEPMTTTPEPATRFDLEQQILDCWKITDDIPLLESQGANPADFTSLANVYHFKFQQLWSTFETLVKDKKL